SYLVATGDQSAPGSATTQFQRPYFDMIFGAETLQRAFRIRPDTAESQVPNAPGTWKPDGDPSTFQARHQGNTSC
ncbi:MAG: hypothetical protein ACREAC_33365, partial [Blastocatellia bacterium]